MVEGVAEYQDPNENGGEPYRIMINENTIKQMDPTFEGLPVYVKHVEEVDWANLQKEADGYVVKSFYNAADGRHWVEFMVVSDKGHEALAKGWRLSNSYIPESFGPGGRWHNVEYLKEIVKGVYNHLAIVDNPRYEESMVLTPEEFKAYNEKKVFELKQLSNSKENKAMASKYIKKTPVENAAELDETSVVLKSGVEKTIRQLINEADEMDMANKKKSNEEELGPKDDVGKVPHSDTSKAKGLDAIKKDNEEEMEMGKGKEMEDCYANGEHKVKVGNEEMTVNELVGRHMKMRDSKPDLSEESPIEKEEEKEEIKANGEDEKDEDKKKEKKENSTDKSKKGERFDALKNAHLESTSEEAPVDLAMDKVARGIQRYGSN